MMHQQVQKEQLIDAVWYALTSLGSGDPTAMAELVSANVEYITPGQHPFAGVHKGKDEFLGLVAALLSQFEDGVIQYNFHRALVCDLTVVLTFQGTGKTRSGKKYDNEYCTLWDFDDQSKVSRVTEFFDSDHVVNTLKF